MIYGLGNVTLTKRQKVKLEKAELKVLRFSLRVAKMDKIHTSDGQFSSSILEARLEATLRWFGHVQRRARAEGKES